MNTTDLQSELNAIRVSNDMLERELKKTTDLPLEDEPEYNVVCRSKIYTFSFNDDFSSLPEFEIDNVPKGVDHVMNIKRLEDGDYRIEASSFVDFDRIFFELQNIVILF